MKTFTTEGTRLAALNKLTTLDTKPEQEFDNIVALISATCETPIALISLVDADRQWFKAKLGLEISSAPHHETFCDHAIKHGGLFQVEDTLKDERFKNNPLVIHSPQVRFYAGMPLIMSCGHAIGTLCVMDHQPRSLTATHQLALQTLSKQIVLEIEMRMKLGELQEAIALAQLHQSELEISNRNLSDLNSNLLSSEEELRASLEQISELQSHLEHREEQYRLLVEEAGDMIYELDRDGRFAFANSTMEKISGFSLQELSKKYYWTLVHVDDQERVIEFYKKQTKDKIESTYLEFRMAPKSGEEAWIGQNVKLHFNDKGMVEKVTSISRDITNLKKTERKLEESEKLYRLLSVNSKDIVSLFEIDDGVTRKFVSPSVKTVLGYEPEELIGKSAFSCVHAEDQERVRQATFDLTMKGHPATIEYRAIKKDGTTVWLESNSSPIVNESGNLCGFQTSARDVTIRKKFESSLREAKEKAESATLAKSQFLSMMSHEIRTPMNAIIGLTNLLLESEPRGDQRESLRLLRFSGENLLTIINDILDFSKIEAGKIMLEEIDVDLHALLNDTKQTLEQRAIEKGISLYITIGENVPRHTVGDPVRLAQILTNLIGNALKFTEKGCVDISVSAIPEDGGFHRVKFVIKDTGIGITPENVNNIFERFSQAEAETTRKYGGTGLGLSITNSLLGLMGSRISVDSAPGYGSTFSFELKMNVSRAPSLPKVNSISPLQINRSTVPTKILLVEDNEVNQVVAVSFLKRWGIEVDVASNGKHALERIQNRSYQLVLMDIQMPVMDGYEAASMIRNIEDPYFKNIPIIALTASAMLGTKELVINAGMNDFIAKPFSPEELRSKIVKYAKVTNAFRKAG